MELLYKEPQSQQLSELPGLPREPDTEQIACQVKVQTPKEAMMKVLLAQNSQVTKHSEKEGSLPKKTENSEEQAAGNTIVKSSPILFLYAVQEEKRQK
eukprot:9715752-Ditylum_brightwellii.AAC.1